MPPKSRGSKAVGGKGPGSSGPNSTTDSKAKIKQQAEKSTSSKDNSVQSAVAEGSKKPDTRTLISGSTSWTGKLPVNLLSEHCQKNKWEKPEYSMVMISAPAGSID